MTSDWHVGQPLTEEVKADVIAFRMGVVPQTPTQEEVAGLGPGAALVLSMVDHERKTGHTPPFEDNRCRECDSFIERGHAIEQATGRRP